MRVDKSLTLRCETYNCHGFKASALYIAKRLRCCDVMCINETWLRPHELSVIPDALAAVDQQFDPASYVIFSKSGMVDSDQGGCGRPFGGVAIICRKLQGLTWQEVAIESNRVNGVLLRDSTGVRQVIINVYMPYFESAQSNNILSFIECLDVLQACLDEWSGSAPLKICGDFNAQLPREAALGRNWFKSKGFNQQSKMLYDFLCSNDLVPMDLSTMQTVKYTYFCVKRGVYTWIDHVLASKFDSCDCTVIEHEADNVSDHLPIRFLVEISTKCEENDENVVSLQKVNAGKRLHWDNSDQCARYTHVLASKLCDLVVKDPSDFCDRASARTYIGKVVNELNEAIHSSASVSGCAKKSHYRPKPYWCADLSYLRDTKRFWWHLWVQNGRPREGAVFECYKFSKKQFRKKSRRCLHALFNKPVSNLNSLFRAGNTKMFWNMIKKKPGNSSTLTAGDFSRHFGNIMKDDFNLDSSQSEIRDIVGDTFMSNCNQYTECVVSPHTIEAAILSLKRGKAAGVDAVTTEHLQYGMSKKLCYVLSKVFSVMLSWHVVSPDMLVGTIVPILKKATLNPNDPSSYRPITISTNYSKLLEMILMPKDYENSHSQFGFSEGLGIDQATSFLYDTISYFNSKSSPVYACSLDAEKCFDRVWHDGLFFKLLPRIPLNNWLILYEWYSNLKAVVKWKGYQSPMFRVTRGIRQGSILSPIFFTMFMDDLLKDISGTEHGVRIAKYIFNNFAYADDITLMAATCPGLQVLIDKCQAYAKQWRFTFGIAKTKCITFGKELLNQPSVWHLGHNCIEITNSVEILGVNFRSDLLSKSHVEKRLSSARRRMFSLASNGFSYPGLTTDVKCYLWATAVRPVLTFGCHNIRICASDIKLLERFQSDSVKRFLGLPKRSHHSRLLRALNLPRVENILSNLRALLYNRIFKRDSPSRTINAVLLANWVNNGDTIDGTLIHQVVKDGHSPLDLAFADSARLRGPANAVADTEDGIVDSLRSLVLSDRYGVPDSAERTLTKLMLRAF